MTISMYAASVPAFRRYMTALSQVLDKGAAYAEARKIDPSVLLQSRLAPDMLPLVSQVRLVSDQVGRGTARLAGAELPKFVDDETTFAQLQDRIARTLDFIGGFSPTQIDGSEAREIVMAMRSGEVRFTGQDYLLGFVIPNVLFHCTAAYLILRHNGVELGKRDFLGAS
jgi:uncharacterized protein